ncbi:MATE family efflux transporter [Faecalicatena orotica]|uniref:Putative MATE family efflux protein n=1 Tax=Faecalicatena orotica TaxID=1544 RepID=A0A2Y9CA40_9FIRM|nr:MATE family efflux transporter [Faecalicatena orotica]PWJ28921.1 putative MATE family efflux protein [Faecalicatena orotica]SSA56090.1 putative efflux protein, MATE family [Faecalicatena orotica]
MGKLFGPVDMTKGTPWKKIGIFTIPMLLGNIAQQLYNTVDSVVVGKYIGDSALAAVGSAGPVVNLLIVLFVGISVGASIVVSQYLGARIRDGLSHTIGNCITLTFIASLLIMVVATLLARPMLQLLNTPDSIIDWCTSYLRILFLGSAGLAFFNILSGVLRGLGDSVSALIYLLISSMINIILDLFFVSVLKLGVDGVAYATIIAQGISGLLCFLKLKRMDTLFDIKPQNLKLKKEFAIDIIRLGFPSGVSQAILATSMLLVQSLTNSFGELFIAANVMVMRVDGFAMLPNQSFGNGLTTYAGQNVGAGDQARVEQGARQGTLMTIITTSVITVSILIFGRNLMGIFTNTEELIATSMKMMMILAPGYVAMGIVQGLTGVMRGAGDTVTPMWIAITMTLFIRVPLSYLLIFLTKSAQYPQGRKEYIFISLTLSLIMGAVMSVYFYRRGKWRGKSVVDSEVRNTEK